MTSWNSLQAAVVSNSNKGNWFLHLILLNQSTSHHIHWTLRLSAIQKRKKLVNFVFLCEKTILLIADCTIRPTLYLFRAKKLVKNKISKFGKIYLYDIFSNSYAWETDPWGLICNALLRLQTKKIIPISTWKIN